MPDRKKVVAIVVVSHQSREDKNWKSSFHLFASIYRENMACRYVKAAE